jgi:hypothetical protein
MIWKSGEFAIYVADPARCIHVPYVDVLCVEIVSIYRKEYVDHVKGLKQEI